MGLKSILRATQTRMPWIRGIKFDVYNASTRLLGWHMEPEFNLLSRIATPRLALDIGGTKRGKTLGMPHHANVRNVGPGDRLHGAIRRECEDVQARANRIGGHDPIMK